MANKDKYHPMDLLANEFWQAVQKRVSWIQGAVGGPVPVGTKKMAPREQMNQYLQMTPGQRAALAASGADMGGILQVLFKNLGEHAFNLIPYVTPMDEPEESEEGMS